jgi:hypothetical protein
MLVPPYQTQIALSQVSSSNRVLTSSSRQPSQGPNIHMMIMGSYLSVFIIQKSLGNGNVVLVVVVLVGVVFGVFHQVVDISTL